MKLASIVFLFLLVVSACTYDNEEDLLGESSCIENVSLTQDVQPIISAHCAVPGCHVSGGQSPNFSQTTTIVNRAVDIRNRTSNRTMPPPASGITLTSEELQTISCWVEQGANAN
uniref:Cytochrome C Planctomycete-type domain-containing protein n=1 Tax=Roseihalotalea indica TaxID=2867963 RepID=A0AA49GLN6_9BACT|nr:hypothetical protein K4G66_29945 [Tunicatimonas sp. TK19036]